MTEPMVGIYDKASELLGLAPGQYSNNVGPDAENKDVVAEKVIADLGPSVKRKALVSTLLAGASVVGFMLLASNPVGWMTAALGVAMFVISYFAQEAPSFIRDLSELDEVLEATVRRQEAKQTEAPTEAIFTLIDEQDPEMMDML